MTQQPYIPNIGHIPDDQARRDAIHVPMTPIVAAERLLPGEHVGLDADGHACRSAEHIGYVDPELPRYGITEIQPGQLFWLWVYQGTVTSLRHAWGHKAFTTKFPGGSHE